MTGRWGDWLTGEQAEKEELQEFSIAVSIVCWWWEDGQEGGTNKGNRVKNVVELPLPFCVLEWFFLMVVVEGPLEMWSCVWLLNRSRQEGHRTDTWITIRDDCKPQWDRTCLPSHYHHVSGTRGVPSGKTKWSPILKKLTDGEVCARSCERITQVVIVWHRREGAHYNTY